VGARNTQVGGIQVALTRWELPSPTDEDVSQLCQLNGLSGVPTLLTYQDHGYGPAFCHISSKDIALKKGGRRVHGWSFWRMIDTDHNTGESHPLMMAEHHSVWETKEGLLIDVTPPRHGGNNTLFLRDDGATIKSESGEIPIRTNLADLHEGVFFRDGETVHYKNYALPEADAARAHQYADSIKFDMSQYSTDQENG